MSEDPDWLPAQLAFSGDWFVYVETLYRCYLDHFVTNTAHWRGKRVGVSYEPEIAGKAFSFWHLTSGVEQGTKEIKEPDFERCARLPWVKALIEAPASKVKTWEQVRGKQRSIGIALPDFSFVVFLAERPDWVYLLTAYWVKNPWRRDKYRRECEASKKR